MIRPAEFYELGERLAKSLILGDFELYQTVMSLPLEINPLEGTAYTLNTLDALRADFDLYHQVNTLHHVTNIVRQITKIRMTGETVAAITSHTELLSGSQRLVEPFNATHHLRRGNDGWSIFRIDSSLGHINWTLRRATISPEGTFKDIDTKDN